MMRSDDFDSPAISYAQRLNLALLLAGLLAFRLLTVWTDNPESGWFLWCCSELWLVSRPWHAARGCRCRMPLSTL
jgi:hypothetical protein